MVTISPRTDLSLTLFGKTRRAVLALLFGHAGEAFYLRQVVRLTGAGLGPVQREIQRLTEAGVVRRSVQGRQVYYQANPDSPVFQELKGLVEKTAIATGSGKAAAHIAIPDRKLAGFCRRHHITRLAFFGSVLREDFRSDSDVDVLVEFEPGHVPGFGIVDMETEVSHILGRKVDLRTPGDLSRHFRSEVVREAEVHYSAT